MSIIYFLKPLNYETPQSVILREHIRSAQYKLRDRRISHECEIWHTPDLPVIACGIRRWQAGILRYAQDDKTGRFVIQSKT